MHNEISLTTANLQQQDVQWRENISDICAKPCNTKAGASRRLVDDWQGSSTRRNWIAEHITSHPSGYMSVDVCNEPCAH